MCDLPSLPYSEDRWKIAYPFEHLKIKKIENLVSPDVASGVQKCSKIRLWPGLCPGPHWGAYSAHAGPLAGLMGPSSKGMGGEK